MACGNCACGRAEAEALLAEAETAADRALFVEMAQNSNCRNFPAKADDSSKSGGCGSGCSCSGNTC
jgi:hypothetical protein